MSRRHGGGISFRDPNIVRGQEAEVTAEQLRIAAHVWRVGSHHDRTVLVLIGDGFFNGAATAHTAARDWEQLGDAVQKRVALRLHALVNLCRNAPP
jgi:hypothetical protein